MRKVTFTCPNCQQATRAPFPGVAAGDAGIWVCDACGTAYLIDIVFTPLAVPRGASRFESAPQTDVPRQAGSFVAAH